MLDSNVKGLQGDLNDLNSDEESDPHLDVLEPE